MILKKIKIENFRSIKNETLEFENDSCKILVGINEAGKSNILKAINALETDYGPENIRRATSGEVVDDYKITYEFALTSTEINDLNIKFSDLFFDNRHTYFIDGDGNKATLSHIISNLKINVFRMSDNKTTYATTLDNYCFIDEVTEVGIMDGLTSEDIPSGLNESVKYFPNDNDIEYKEIYNLYDPNFSEFKKLVYEEINSLISIQRKKVVLWEYNEQNILPSEINAKEFLSNPDCNKTLKSFFEICQRPNWNTEILNKLSDRSHIDSYIKNAYLDKILAYFKDKWPELKLKDIKVKLDGENLLFSFIDEGNNEFNTEERSDGFKRFITFLILISGKNLTGEIKDNIIIVDEPDLAIHIKGQRYLLKELLTISENNIVVFTTHSPFMIDKSNIDRHYIVEKNNEITTLRISDYSNYSEEEVLNQAIGFSVFCRIKDNNVLFEGYWDNQVFKLFKDERHQNIGHVFMGGVKNAQSVSKTIELQEKNYFILSDSDIPAKRGKANFALVSDGKWIEYNEIVPDIETLEDFVNNDKIKSALKNVLKLQEFASISTLNLDFVDTLTYKKLDKITRACKKLDNALNVESFHKKLKEKIFKDIKPTHISSQYNLIVDYIAQP